jgi:glycosyltransferase involved in cell wall biosynthesis
LDILFLLPVGGNGGGIHSVVQEVAEMRRLGVKAKVAIRSQNRAEYVLNYSEILDVEKLFLSYANFDEINSAVRDFDVVIATIFSSVELLMQLKKNNRWIIPAYYIQDYEPLFFRVGTGKHTLAVQSYTAIPEAVFFAKTRWIIDEVRRHHGVVVHKVAPSIDHDVYRPAGRRTTGARLNVIAMVRPQTPRRGAARTMRLLARLERMLPSTIRVTIFGCDDNDLQVNALEREFSFRNLGVLKRPEVAAALQEASIFIDLSDYQAFGRTALEAMACGAVAIVPKFGGSDEFAIDSINTLIVDPFDEEGTFERVLCLLRAPRRLAVMQNEALLTASKYSSRSAAISELQLFARQATLRNFKPSPLRRKHVIIMPALMGNGQPAGSGYVRLIHPYAGGHLPDYRFDIQYSRTLPRPGSADIILIQREMGGIPLDEYLVWVQDWRAAGGKIVFDIDDDLTDMPAIMARTGRTKNQAMDLVERIKILAGSADVVVVSMPALESVMRAYNQHVRLVKNYLDEPTWWISTERPNGADVFVRKPGDPIRIGYIGTPTHDQDLEMVAAAVNRLEAEFGQQIVFEIIGAFERRPPLFGKKIGLPKVTEYPGFVEWLGKRVNWDIGIIPLVDDNFNRSKSFLKFIEYSALDIAIVCSQVTTYCDVAKHEQNCLSVPNTIEDWYQAIKRLILDADLRHRLVVQARQDLVAGYTIQGNRYCYEAILSEALQGTATPVAAEVA